MLVKVKVYIMCNNIIIKSKTDLLRNCCPSLLKTVTKVQYCKNIFVKNVTSVEESSSLK